MNTIQRIKALEKIAGLAEEELKRPRLFGLGVALPSRDYIKRNQGTGTPSVGWIDQITPPRRQGIAHKVTNYNPAMRRPKLWHQKVQDLEAKDSMPPESPVRDMLYRAPGAERVYRDRNWAHAFWRGVLRGRGFGRRIVW